MQINDSNMEGNCISVSDKRIEYGSDKANDKQKALRESGNMVADFKETFEDSFKVDLKTFNNNIKYEIKNRPHFADN